MVLPVEYQSVLDFLYHFFPSKIVNVGGLRTAITADTHITSLDSGWYTFGGFKPKGAPTALGYNYGNIIVYRNGDYRFLCIYANETAAIYFAYTFGGSVNLNKWLQLSGTLVSDLVG